MLDPSQDTIPSMDPQPVENRPSFFADPKGPQALPPPVTDVRAEKYAYATGQDKDTVNAALVGGAENLFRQQIATKTDDENLQHQRDIMQYWLNENRPDIAAQIATIPKTDPDTVLEKQYAAKVTSDTMFRNAADPNSLLVRLGAEKAMHKGDQLLDVLSENIAHQEYIRRNLENDNAEYAKTGVNRQLGDFIENMIPFMAWWRESNLTNAPNKPFLHGDNLMATSDYMNGLPLEQFALEFQKGYQYLKQHNPQQAFEWAQAILAYGHSDAFFSNLGSLADLSTFSGVASGAAKIAGRRFLSEADKLVAGAGIISPERQLSAEVQGILSVHGRRGPVDVPAVISETGQTMDAAAARAAVNLKAVQSGLAERDPQALKQTVVQNIPSFSDPFAFLRGASRLDREATSRVSANASNNLAEIESALQLNVGLERMSSDEAIQAAVARAKDQATKEFSHIDDAIADISWIRAEDDFTNVHSIAVDLGQRHPIQTSEHAYMETPTGSSEHVLAVDLKRPNQTPFDTAAQAVHWGQEEYKLGTVGKDFAVLPQGEKFYIRVTRPVDETAPAVRDQLIQTGNTSPESRANSWIGILRSSNDVLPEDQNLARKQLVHGPQQLFRVFKDLYNRDINSLPGAIRGVFSQSSKKDFLRFVTQLRDTATDTGRGTFFNTVGDFENAWHESFNRFPTEKETRAYMTYVQLNDMDYTLRNLGIYRTKARQGIMNFELGIPQLESNALSDAENTIPTHGKSFEGRFVDENPVNLKGRNVLFWSKDKPTITIKDRNITPEQRAVIQNAVDNEGYRVIQVANPFTLPLKEGTGETEVIDYVITKDFKTSRLDLEQIPYRPGGHVAYDYDNYVKQPKTLFNTGTQYYLGDTTLRPIATRSQALKVAKNYDEARLLLKAGKNPEFDDFVTTHLPEDPQVLRAHFLSGELSLDHPIVATDRGIPTLNHPDVKPRLAGAVNASADNRNLYKDLNKEYAGERNYDLSTVGIDASGTEENPLFRLDAPQLIDPLTTLNRALSSLGRNAYIEDYRILSAEHFVQEFRDVMMPSAERLEDNPIAAMYDPKWNNRVTADLQPKLAAAKLYQRRTLDLLGVQTQTEKELSRLKRQIYEYVYDKVGQKYADIVDDHLLPLIKNPVQFAKSVAFNLHLGFLNPVQYIRQLQTLTQVMALSGVEIGTKATLGAGMFRMLSVSPSAANLDHFAKMAAAAGWRADDFKEAWQWFNRSGLKYIEGELAYRDDFMSPKLFKGTVGKFLDKSTVFFKEGERTTRAASFLAAYAEWRKANPYLVLDRKGFQQIMLRQDLMNVNMTRASNSTLNKGVWSIPLQFATYQIRMWEQFMGKRLTQAEKIRSFLTYSALYGVPVGLGASAVGIYPFYEDIRQALVEKGITDTNPIVEGIHKGIIEVGLHMLTGRENDFPESMGPGGLDILRNLNKKSVWDAFFGVSGGTMSQVINTTYPLLRDIKNVFYDGQDGSGDYNVLVTDLLQAAKNIQTLSNADKVYTGLSLGIAKSRGEIKLDDVNTIESALLGLGINPESIDRAYAGQEALADQKTTQDKYRKEIVKYLVRAFKSTDDADRLANFRAAKANRILGNFTMSEFSSIWNEASKNNESLVDSLNKRMLLKGPYAPDRINSNREGQ